MNDGRAGIYAQTIMRRIKHPFFDIDIEGLNENDIVLDAVTQTAYCRCGRSKHYSGWQSSHIADRCRENAATDALL